MKSYQSVKITWSSKLILNLPGVKPISEVFRCLTFLDKSFAIINHIDILSTHIHMKTLNTIIFLDIVVIKSCQ